MSVCAFILINNFPEEGFRSGRYSRSFHWDIPGYCETKWVVLAYIAVGWKEKEKMGQSRGNIFQDCIDHLNSLKDPKTNLSLYGKLEPYRADFKEKNDKMPERIIAQLMINQRKNKCFWCEGPTSSGISKSSKKRGRPKKIK